MNLGNRQKPSLHTTPKLSHPQECIICLENLSGEVAKTKECGHVFCHSCIGMWIKRGNMRKRVGPCPYCKRMINRGNLLVYKNYINRVPPSNESEEDKAKRQLKRVENERRNR